ncbi:hypothetical protein LCGC14_1171020 [marine sediment metagenome]|uniref:Uncharacterized protein n=1 Tax=marine sediment metagenome TaxID=412755 RepID=A0A0F9LUN0_9ZZZZ
MSTLLTILIIATGLPVTFLVLKLEKDRNEAIKWIKFAHPVTWKERI